MRVEGAMVGGWGGGSLRCRGMKAARVMRKSSMGE